MDSPERQRHAKVCVLIDNNALVAITKLPVNFRRLREWLVAHREAAIVKVYCGEVRNEQRERFYNTLKSLGFEVYVSKNARSGSRSAKDDEEVGRAISCEIAWDMCALLSAGYYDSFVLVSGAFELSDVVSSVRQRGIEVEVAFPPSSCSPTLRSRASVFRPLKIEAVLQSQMEDRGEGVSQNRICQPQRVALRESLA